MVTDTTRQQQQQQQSQYQVAPTTNWNECLEKRETTANNMDHAYYDSIIRRKRYRYAETTL